jgi:hypothetical protein
MSDTYQAVYDAVRSKISGGDISQTVRDVLWQQFDISHSVDIVRQEFLNAAMEMQRPSAVFKPLLTQDGDAFLAIYGDLPTGVVGAGKTPSEAMADFDAAWVRAARVPGVPQGGKSE